MKLFSNQQSGNWKRCRCSPKLLRGQGRDNVLVVDQPVDLVHVGIIPGCSCWVEHPGRSSIHYCHLCLDSQSSSGNINTCVCCDSIHYTPVYILSDKNIADILSRASARKGCLADKSACEHLAARITVSPCTDQAASTFAKVSSRRPHIGEGCPCPRPTEGCQCGPKTKTAAEDTACTSVWFDQPFSVYTLQHSQICQDRVRYHRSLKEMVEREGGSPRNARGHSVGSDSSHRGPRCSDVILRVACVGDRVERPQKSSVRLSQVNKIPPVLKRFLHCSENPRSQKLDRHIREGTTWKESECFESELQREDSSPCSLGMVP